MGGEKEGTVSINYLFKKPDGWEGERMGTIEGSARSGKKNFFPFKLKKIE